MEAIDAAESDYLFVSKSQLVNAGSGLFTVIPIYKNEIVSYFDGEILDQNSAELKSLNGNDSYFINMPDGSTMDSENTECFAKYANDANGFQRSTFRNNCKISLDDERVCLIAITDISARSELFCSYGAPYWKNFRRKNLVR